jgi:hypothetical protein
LDEEIGQGAWFLTSMPGEEASEKPTVVKNTVSNPMSYLRVQDATLRTKPMSECRKKSDLQPHGEARCDFDQKMGVSILIFQYARTLHPREGVYYPVGAEQE